MVTATGPSGVDVYFEGPHEGVAFDDDGDGRDEVVTELVQADFDGFHPKLGRFQIGLRDDLPSLGQIIELTNGTPGVLDLDPFAPGNADSFFDVFFEITLPATGQVLTTVVPTRLEAVIDDKPPEDGERYMFTPPQPVELFFRDPVTGALTPSGIFILREIHDEDPTIENDVFPKTVGQILIEIPDDSVIVTPSPLLPPLEAVYLTAEDVHAMYSGQDLAITLANVRHRALATPTPEITISGDDEVETFQTVLTATAIISSLSLGVVEVPVELTGPVTTIVRGKAGHTTGSWDTEMVSMSLSGDVALPGGPTLTLTVEESDSEASLGHTTIDSDDGRFQIDSFFDIFTEISIDGGTPIPSAGSTRVDAFPIGVQRASGELPPDDGVYRTATEVHAQFNGQDLDIVLADGRHHLFTNIRRTPNGADEMEEFDSVFDAVAIINGRGLTDLMVPIQLTGPVETIVSGKVGNETGTFQTEIVQMDLSGQLNLPGIGQVTLAIREDPQLDSDGETTIRELTDGSFNVESFFDVFTEISIDGGDTWTPAETSTVVHLHEEPERILVSGVGEARVDVFFEGPEEGNASDDDGDGLDEVPAELKHLALNGFLPGVGNFQLAERPGAAWPSLGMITEQMNVTPGTLDVDPFTQDSAADSFFDVWPQITIAGQSFFTPAPTRLESAIDDKPPEDGERYIFNPPLPMPLITADGRLTQLRIVREIHDTTTVEHDVIENTTALVQLVGGPFGTVPQTLTLVGSSEVEVFFEGPAEGVAHDDDDNGLDEVETQLVSLDLSGGGISLSIRPEDVFPFAPSLGRIEELVNHTVDLLDLDPFAAGQAESYFDVFFQIDVGGGQVLHNNQPLRIEAIISEKPPFSRYVHIIPLGGAIELLNENNQPSGIFVTRAEHRTAIVEVDEFPDTRASITLVDLNSGLEEEVALRGPATVHVLFEGPAEGDAADEDGDGLDEVQTEIVSMNLTGSSSLGGVTVRQRADLPSIGEIEELVNNNTGLLDIDPFAAGDADSFFDVFFDIEINGQRFVTSQPKRMRTIITEKPPAEGETYESPEIVELLDSVTLQPTGLAIGTARHTPRPPIEIDKIEETTGLVQLVGGPLGNVPVPFILRGSSEVHVLFEGPAEGDAVDDDGNDLDEVDTELVQLDLTDGSITLSLNPNQASLGQIEELLNNTAGLLDLDPFADGDADSFFDVFFQIDVGGGLVLHNDAALRMEAVISEKPPIARYFHILPPAGPIELLDANNDPSGVFIVKAEHFTGHVEVDEFEHSIAEIELESPDGTVEVIKLSGPSKVHVFFEGAEGIASDDDDDNLDEVQTEMVALSLTGTSSLGPVVVRLNPNAPTLGEIEERSNDNVGLLDLEPFAAGEADSFFDVFFEIELPDGTVLHNNKPKRMSTVIKAKPPELGAVYESPERIALLDDAGNDTGFARSWQLATRRGPPLR